MPQTSPTPRETSLSPIPSPSPTLPETVVSQAKETVGPPRPTYELPTAIPSTPSPPGTAPLKEFEESSIQDRRTQPQEQLQVTPVTIESPRRTYAPKEVASAREVLPWMRTQSQNELTNISRTYEKLYPGSLDKLNIPRDALIDPIANNYFMAGRWKEWEEKFSQRPRDKNGLIIYP